LVGHAGGAKLVGRHLVLELVGHVPTKLVGHVPTKLVG
jgi:hypothetical protein